MTVKKISDNAVLGNDIPPALQAELEAMNSQWREEVQPRDDEGESDEQPETDALSEYRIEVLGKAAHIVSAERNIEYGAPEDNFRKIAALWSAYLDGEILPTDVAAMMMLLKIARLEANPFHEDGWIDAAGYAACGASAARDMSAGVPESE